MSSGLHRRIVSLAALAAFAATAAADAYGLHTCPHHDALPAATSPEVPAASEPFADRSGSGAAHEDAGAVHRPGADPAPTGHGADPAHSLDPAVVDAGDPAARAPSHDHGPCSCVGECATSTVGPPVAPAHVEFALPAPGAVAPRPANAPPLPRPTAHLLPWATAPPLR